MKRAKILSIMLASAMVSVNLGITPIFAAEDVSINNEENAVNSTLEKTTSASTKLKAADVSNVKVDVTNGSSANTLAPTITITNTGSGTLDLKNLKLKYFYTADGNEKQIFNCYYAGTTTGEYLGLTGNVVGKIVQLDSKADNADSYIEVSFNGGSLEAGQAAQLQISVNKEGWTSYDQSNDFSYNNGKNIAAYENNKLVWGNEPNGGTSSDPVIENAELDKSSIDVDKADVKDETINIKLNGNKFTGITGLKEGTDYTVKNGNVVILKSSYLNKLEAGNTTLTFNFNQGEAQKLNVNVKEIVTPPVIKNAELDRLSIDVDKTNVKDETINIKLNGNKFTGIAGLKEGTDYTVSNGSVVILKSDYLKNLAEGNTSLTFNFDQGASQKLNINVKKSSVIETPEMDAVISPVTVDYNKADITVQMTLNGKTLSAVKNNGVSLVLGTDYVLDGDKVVLKQSYLDTLPDGQATNLTFDFNSGKSQTLTVNVPKAAVTEGIVINIPDVKAKEGETIKIPVNITGIDPVKGLNGCNFKLKYDTNVFENVTVEAGDIVANPVKTFSKSINKNTGSIGILFADSTGKELEAIEKDGLFMNINLKVKDGVKDTTTKLEVTKAGKFVDKFSKAYTVNYTVGNITIGEGKTDDPIVVVKDSTLTKTSADYDTKNPEAVEVGMVLNGNELSSIKDAGKVLSEGVDYTVNGTTVTFSAKYLDSLAEGSNKLTFSFNQGADAEFAINVSKEAAVEDVLAASIGNVQAKAGETIVLPVTLTKAPDTGIANFGYRINYDPKLIDVLSVKAGDAITNPDVNFVSEVYPDDKMLSVIFLDAALSEEETIKTGGVLTNIELKVKNDAPAGIIPIEFKNDDHSFYDMDGNEIQVRFDAGSITVK